MRNLCYFCHYHRGDAREKTIKIVGSFLIIFTVLVSAWSGQSSLASEAETAYLAELLPEPGYLIATTVAQETQPAEMAPPPTVEPAMPPPDDEEREKQEKFEQERRMQETTRWKNDRLRETRDQLREIAKVRKQFVRLKGSQDEIAKLDALSARIKEYVNTLNATTDLEDLQGALEDYDGEEIWEEVNKLRSAIEIPRELNNLLREITRLKSTCKQKWVDKVFGRAECAAIVGNFEAKHGEAKAAYQAGEYDDARTIIQETFHEPGWPGDVMGALHMMRGFTDSLRGIRDKALKEELTGLMTECKESLTSGDFREGRECMEAINRELGPQIFRLITNAERRRQEIPESVLEKLERLRAKFEAEEQQPVPMPPIPTTPPASSPEAQPVQ